MATDGEGPVWKVYRKPWWLAASAVARVGWDVTVMDPDAEAPETYTVDHDTENHGVITVVPCMALGWTLVVHECEPDAADEDDAG